MEVDRCCPGHGVHPGHLVAKDCGAKTCGSISDGCGHTIICGPTCTTCFVAGTPILLADGSTKAIEEVAPGDVVLAYDEETGALAHGMVAALLAHPPDSRGLLRINGGLTVTPEHRFFVDGAWRAAGDLRVGDSLLEMRSRPDSSGLSPASVLVERIESVPGGVPTYNFEVARYHNYFAGGMLVHNIKATGAVAPAPTSSQPSTAVGP